MPNNYIPGDFPWSIGGVIMNNNTKEMFERARNGDKEVRKQLIENNIGIAISIAIKYTRSKTIDIETAKQIGRASCRERV